MLPHASPSPTPVAVAIVHEIYTPQNGSIYLGARANPTSACAANASDGCFIAQTALLEAAIGRKLALNNSYHGWANALTGPQEQDDITNGRMPVIAWNCGYPNSAIAAGLFDAQIAAQAANVKAFGKPVFLRWFWEFNLPDSSNTGRQSCYDPATDGPADASHAVPANYFSPTQFVAAWRHIHDAFAALGVTNVVWLWCPSANPLGPSPASYYPGDGYVDALAFDDYDRVIGQSFTQTIGYLYGELAALPATGPKPIYLTETGALPADQATFLSQAQSAVPITFPQLKGIMYFDAPGTVGWSLTTTGSGGLSAFAQLANNSYMTAMPNLAADSPQSRFRRR